MSRACDECGIPRWSDCQCDNVGLGHPRLPLVAPATFTPARDIEHITAEITWLVPDAGSEAA